MLAISSSIIRRSSSFLFCSSSSCLNAFPLSSSLSICSRSVDSFSSFSFRRISPASLSSFSIPCPSLLFLNVRTFESALSIAACSSLHVYCFICSSSFSFIASNRSLSFSIHSFGLPLILLRTFFIPRRNSLLSSAAFFCSSSFRFLSSFNFDNAAGSTTRCEKCWRDDVVLRVEAVELSDRLDCSFRPRTSSFPLSRMPLSPSLLASLDVGRVPGFLPITLASVPVGGVLPLIVAGSLETPLGRGCAMLDGRWREVLGPELSLLVVDWPDVRPPTFPPSIFSSSFSFFLIPSIIRVRRGRLLEVLSVAPAAFRSLNPVAVFGRTATCFRSGWDNNDNRSVTLPFPSFSSPSLSPFLSVPSARVEVVGEMPGEFPREDVSSPLVCRMGLILFNFETDVFGLSEEDSAKIVFFSPVRPFLLDE
ncbi:hypothetical protein BLNAU_17662 [Blattamonas nauphoetae]|uniref:Uncharacterized protein n=1 Tax=Blattamonas nauphoetae TaxID=2049346 RepID=A0ABQ9X6L6_9EUKA|nr:hypothetical protein BLNAU_17662 [Blattamonas nauphoetae]